MHQEDLLCSHTDGEEEGMELNLCGTLQQDHDRLEIGVIWRFRTGLADDMLVAGQTANMVNDRTDSRQRSHLKTSQ